jgi:branched-chain amino acid:cation transporter, LIVCS family
MSDTKRIFLFGFALFAGFFGAGNLILPPFLGFNSGSDWWLVAIGFLVTTTVIPMLSLFGHAKLQGSMLDFGKKVSTKFSLVYCLIMFLIIIVLPAPRTAAVTHEMAIAPLFGTSPLLTSCIYFVLVLVFVLNRSKALNLLGKYLTPIIVIMVLTIVVLGILSPPDLMRISKFETPIVDGLLEGYQTYDAIAGILMGGFIIMSLNKNEAISYAEKKRIIAKSGAIAMLGLFVIYVGLIALGAFYSETFAGDITRTDLLLGLSQTMLGNIGGTFVSVLVALACFTTAVAIVVSLADFFKALYPQKENIYTYIAIICCIVGVVMGSYDVGFIIDIAIPALLLIYPISIALILLNILPDQWATPLVSRAVVVTAFVFSIPDVLGYFLPKESLQPIVDVIPLAKYSLGWVLPALVVFGIVSLVQPKQKTV